MDGHRFDLGQLQHPIARECRAVGAPAPKYRHGRDGQQYTDQHHSRVDRTPEWRNQDPGDERCAQPGGQPGSAIDGHRQETDRDNTDSEPVVPEQSRINEQSGRDDRNGNHPDSVLGAPSGDRGQTSGHHSQRCLQESKRPGERCHVGPQGGDQGPIGHRPAEVEHVERSDQEERDVQHGDGHKTAERRSEVCRSRRQQQNRRPEHTPELPPRRDRHNDPARDELTLPRETAGEHPADRDHHFRRMPEKGPGRQETDQQGNCSGPEAEVERPPAGYRSERQVEHRQKKDDEEPDHTGVEHTPPDVPVFMKELCDAERNKLERAGLNLGVAEDGVPPEGEQMCAGRPEKGIVDRIGILDASPAVCPDNDDRKQQSGDEGGERHLRSGEHGDHLHQISMRERRRGRASRLDPFA